jgi:hypothetical protein
MLAPKNDWMILHIEGDKQKKAWLEVYKTMKYRYFIGIIVGLLAAIPLTSSLC